MPQLWHDSVRGLTAGVVGGTAGPAARIALADGLSLTSTGLRVVGQGIGDVAEVLAQKQGFSLGVLPKEAKLSVGGDKFPNSARFGDAVSTDYRATFFHANPELQGKVIVHHAVEQQVLKRYPGVVTEAEIHSLENLRGIPKALNSDLHLS